MTIKFYVDWERRVFTNNPQEEIKKIIQDYLEYSRLEYVEDFAEENNLSGGDILDILLFQEEPREFKTEFMEWLEDKAEEDFNENFEQIEIEI